jgi:hypothetical protein
VWGERLREINLLEGREDSAKAPIRQSERGKCTYDVHVLLRSDCYSDEGVEKKLMVSLLKERQAYHHLDYPVT